MDPAVDSKPKLFTLLCLVADRATLRMSSFLLCWHRHASFVEKTISHTLGQWGVIVTRKPLTIILLSIVVHLFLTAFVVRMETNDDTIDSWAPDTSISFANWEQYQSTWAVHEDEIKHNTLLVTLKDDPSGNVLTKETLILLLDLYDTINEIEIEHDGMQYTYQDICARYQNGNCYIQSILELFQFDLDTLTSTYNSTTITYPAVYSPYSFGHIYVPWVLGQNISTDFNGIEYVTAASAFEMRFWIDFSTIGQDICYKWYEQFISVAEKYKSESDELEVFYEGYRSFDAELNSTIVAAQNLIVVGFFGLFILFRVV